MSHKRAEPAVPTILIATLLIGTVLNPINSSLIATALTPIGRSLHVGSAQTAWLVASLYLVAAVAQPLMGRLADLIGPRRVFMGGLMVALLGGVIGGLATTLAGLIAARVLIGVGTSAGFPSTMAVLSRRAARTGQPTPRSVLAAVTVASQVLAVVGPTIGGVLVGGLGWHSVFLVNVPVTLVGLGLAWMHLPRESSPARPGDVLRHIDVPGVLLFTVALVSLLLFLMNLVSAPPYGWLAAAVVAFAGLFVVERRTERAFLDVRMLAGRLPLLLTYLTYGLTALVIYSLFYGLPQWLQEARGFTPAGSGLILLPISLISMVVTVLMTRWPRLGVQGMLRWGAGLLMLCMALYVLVPQQPALGLLLGGSVLLGVPWGLINLGCQQSLALESPKESAGSAAGLFRTFAYLGSILSSSVISLTYQPSATTVRFQSLTWVLLVASRLVLVVVTCWAVLNRRRIVSPT